MLALVASILLSAVLYQFGMAHLEGKPRTFLQAIEWSAETLSTTGYGADSRWTHPAMVLLVVIVQFAGVFLVFLIIPVFLLPYLLERFEQRLPRDADERLSNHVVIFRYGPAVETLVQRLAANHVPSLVVETDEMQARAVMESGQAVVFSRSEEDALDGARVDRARALVANGRDEENAALILRARQRGFRGEIYAFVEEPAHRKPMELAGATAAYTPRHIVAAALAAHASDLLSPRLPGLDEVAGLCRREIRVPAASPMCGRRMVEIPLGVALVGLWQQSRMQPIDSNAVFEAGMLLEVVGSEKAVERAAAELGAVVLQADGPLVIAGFGEVGRKVHQLLCDAGEEVRVIERIGSAGVDVVGDVLDSSVMERAQLESARALILALDSDDATLFATVIARDLAPRVRVFARVNHGRNVENIHRAGADFALSISDVSGEMLSSRLLGRGTRLHHEQRRIVAVAGERFAGRSLAAVEAGEGVGTIVAIERGGQVLPRQPELTIEAGDTVWVCGTRSV